MPGHANLCGNIEYMQNNNSTSERNVWSNLPGFHTDFEQAQKFGNSVLSEDSFGLPRPSVVASIMNSTMEKQYEPNECQARKPF